MRIFPIRLAIFAAVASASLLAAPARAVVLDWNSAPWAPGDLTNSYDVTGDGVNDITVQITSKQANIWTTDPTSGMQAPAVNRTLTGGIPAQNSLMLAANLHTNSDATVQISFTGGPGGQTGANNVSFTIFDIDITTNSDIISGIYGVLPNGTFVPATITNVGAAVSLTGAGLAQTLTGIAAAADNSSNGNATISFGSTLITDVFFTFGNTSGAPRYQDIGLSNITFTPVPEINPAATAAVSCALAIGLTVFARRRARRKADALLAPKA